MIFFLSVGTGLSLIADKGPAFREDYSNSFEVSTHISM